MPRTLRLLLLISALAAPPCAARAVAQDDRREDIRTVTQAVAVGKKKDPETWFRLGIEYNRAGDLENARKAFRQALKLRSNFPNARAGLAYTFFVEKKFNEAEKEAYPGTIYESHPPDSLADRVLAAVRLERYREVAAAALEHADAALAKNPNDPDWNRVKAEALIALFIPEQKIPPDLSFPTKPSPPPDEATREATRRRDKEAADCLEKYLRLAQPPADEAHLREQLEALRFYAQVREDLPPAERLYSSSELSSKALIVYKPEPDYTSKARKAGLIGMTRLRATLAADGTVKHVLVIMPLPHGMSEQAVKAARRIRFKPATVGGVPVSQNVILEYNFGIY